MGQQQRQRESGRVDFLIPECTVCGGRLNEQPEGSNRWVCEDCGSVHHKVDGPGGPSFQLAQVEEETAEAVYSPGSGATEEEDLDSLYGEDGLAETPEETGSSLELTKNAEEG